MKTNGQCREHIQLNNQISISVTDTNAPHVIKRPRCRSNGALKIKSNKVFLKILILPFEKRRITQQPVSA